MQAHATTAEYRTVPHLGHRLAHTSPTSFAAVALALPRAPTRGPAPAASVSTPPRTRTRFVRKLGNTRPRWYRAKGPFSDQFVRSHAPSRTTLTLHTVQQIDTRLSQGLSWPSQFHLIRQTLDTASPASEAPSLAAGRAHYIQSVPPQDFSHARG